MIAMPENHLQPPAATLRGRLRSLLFTYSDTSERLQIRIEDSTGQQAFPSRRLGRDAWAQLTRWLELCVRATSPAIPELSLYEAGLEMRLVDVSTDSMSIVQDLYDGDQCKSIPITTTCRALEHFMHQCLHPSGRRAPARDLLGVGPAGRHSRIGRIMQLPADCSPIDISLALDLEAAPLGAPYACLLAVTIEGNADPALEMAYLQRGAPTAVGHLQGLLHDGTPFGVLLLQATPIIGMSPVSAALDMRGRPIGNVWETLDWRPIRRLRNSPKPAPRVVLPEVDQYVVPLPAGLTENRTFTTPAGFSIIRRSDTEVDNHEVSMRTILQGLLMEVAGVEVSELLRDCEDAGAIPGHDGVEAIMRHWESAGDDLQL